MFSVPPGTTHEEVLELAHNEIHWAMSSGPYAAPELWYPRIPALVSLLKAMVKHDEETR